MPLFYVREKLGQLPPKALARLGRAFHGELAKRLLNDADLRDAATHSKAFWSPRRLAVRITGLRALQPERTVDRLGPAVAQAFGADGKPTKAAEGFARSCGVALEQLGQKDGKLHFRTTLPGQPLAALVPDAVRGALDALPIPKRMRWGAGEALFVRPVHWLVLLEGEKVIECEVMGVWSGRDSRGHRFHHPGPVTIARPADYFDALKKNKVWLDGDALTSAGGGSVRPSCRDAGRDAHHQRRRFDDDVVQRPERARRSNRQLRRCREAVRLGDQQQSRRETSIASPSAPILTPACPAATFTRRISWRRSCKQGASGVHDPQGRVRERRSAAYNRPLCARPG